MHLLLRAGLLTLFYFLPHALFAQSYRLINYQTSDGLSTNLTKAVVQDKTGFIWIATDDGIVRFDGKKFKKFKQGAPSNYNKSVLVSSQGKILVCNDFGILEVINHKEKVTFRTLLAGATDTSDPKKVHYPKAVFESLNNDLWISEPTSVFRLFANGKTKRYALPKKYHTNHFIRSFSFTQTADQTLWAISYTGYLLRYNAPADRFEEVKMNLAETLSATSCMVAIDQHTFWLGATQGIFAVKLHPKTRQVVQIQKIYPAIRNVSTLSKTGQGVFVGTWGKQLFRVQPNQPQKKAVQITEYKTNVVNHVFSDKGQNLWISSDEGLNLLIRNEFQPIKLTEYPAYIEDIDYNSKTRQLLVCDGAKIHTIDNQSEAFSHKIAYEEAQGGLTATTQNQDKIFIGTRDGFVVLLDKNTQKKELVDLSNFGKSVCSMHSDNKGNVWVCQYDKKAGVVKIDSNLVPQNYAKAEGIGSLVTVVKTNQQNELYCGARGKGSYLYKYNKAQNRFDNVSTPLDINPKSQFAVNDLFFDKKGQLWLATTQGLWLKNNKNVRRINLGQAYTKEDIKSVAIDQYGTVWVGTHVGILKLKDEQVVLFDKDNGLSTETIAYRGIQTTSRSRLFVGTAKGLNYVRNNKVAIKVTPTPVFLHLEAAKKTINIQNNTLLKFPHNTTIEGQFMSFTYPNKKVVYQYRIQGLLNEWSEANNQNQLTIPRIPYGRYVLEIRAKQQGNYSWSQALTLSFLIDQAWYFTPLALIGYAAGLALLLWTLVRINTQRLTRQKVKLEGLVQERTVELATKNDRLQQAYNLVNEQKLEITTRNDELQLQQEELASQRDFIMEKNDELERQSRQIQMSMNAALTIQHAILPYQEKLDRLLKNYFILYRPKDVVSGDFYWVNAIGTQTVFVVADCTGHGVPGAFMTLIGNTLLDKIVRVWKITDPAEVLDRLHKEIVIVLKQKYTGNSNGMDALVMVVEHGGVSKKMKVAGAKMPLFCKRKDSHELERIRGDRRHIGGIQKNKKAFTNKEVELFPGDMIYAGSDGYSDQCNKVRRSFGTRRFIELLTEIAPLPLGEQKQQMETTLDNYMQGTEQRDDILVIGVRVGG